MPTSPEPETAAPSRRRDPVIDVLRGIAILGTLATNIFLFTSGFVALDEAGDLPWLHRVVNSLSNGKFLGLLTIMFGIGLEIQRQAARRAGRRWPGTYPVRAGLLFLDGVLNYVLVVQFDVLRAYAVTGFVVAFLLLTSERVQLWIAAVFVAVHVPFTFWNGVASTLTRDGQGIRVGMSADSADVPGRTLAPPSGEIGGYWAGVRGNLSSFWDGFSLDSEFSAIVVMGIAMFLLGARLYREGVFEPSGRRLRRWLMVVGLGVGMPAEQVLRSDVLGIGLDVANPMARYLAAPVIAFGLLAAVAEFYQHRPVGRAGRLLAGVGVTALSCYMLQNIIGVALSHTLVSAVDLSALEATYATWALFVGISAVLVVFANLWLRRFSRGPFEMFWHWCYRAITGDGGRPRARARREPSG
ncbi:predicted membrane protein [Sanguibacter keddieii DSM 10542]|uniref:Predicted membrane protein n=1 Tax=Sanguibacter keddieii (strain ATCC 51767 / DSM 10542 / NCFB 3025 / ST-74) TaxID=446469 RepID=D1BJZ4_SANKS|nr:predicted membrane protein [Sanguibacter keddieii DSM 10542]